MRQQGWAPVRREIAAPEPEVRSAAPQPEAARAHAVQQEYGNAVVGAALEGERLDGLGDDVLSDLALSWIGFSGEGSNQARLARLRAAGWVEDAEPVDADPLWSFPSLFEDPDWA